MTASLLSRRPAGIYKMNRMNISSRRFHEKIIRNMKKIALLLPCGEVMGSAVVGPYAIFTEVNAFLAQRGQPPAFKVELVGCKRVPSFSEGAFRVQPHCLLEHASGYDMAIVPGFTSEAESMLAANQPLIGWLKQQYEMHGTELASLCSGAFFIAATGLANGKKCTTHWAYAAEFRARFPKVNLLADRIVTDDGGIYASGGAYSSLNLVLYLLEKFCGKTAAVWAAKVFQIDLHRTLQQPEIAYGRRYKPGAGIHRTALPGAPEHQRPGQPFCVQPPQFPAPFQRSHRQYAHRVPAEGSGRGGQAPAGKQRQQYRGSGGRHRV